MTLYIENPKLVGSNLVACTPQVGKCPNQCPECFYDGDRYFRPLDDPMLPSASEVKNKIVRVNDGHDSNLQKKLVLEKTVYYAQAFFNTAIPNFDFPSPLDGRQRPVVFTCNGGKLETLKLVEPAPNLMFVRVRANSWDMATLDAAVGHYLVGHQTPVVLTFMRYYNGDLIPASAKDDYEWKKHVQNSYYCIKNETILGIMNRYKGLGVRMCGALHSSFCVDCRNCEFLYWETMRRLG